MIGFRKMKGQAEDINIHEQAFILIGAILAAILVLAVVYMNLNPTLSNTPQARASLTANTLAMYLGSLSAVDEGSAEKNLNETYIIQIGKYSGFTTLIKTKPVSNYYLKALLYDEKGNPLGDSGEVPFIAYIDLSCQKAGICLTTEKITFVRFTKKAGEGVKLEGFENAAESGFASCTKAEAQDIQTYVEKYSAQYNVEKPFILAVMGAESYLQHCDRYGFVKHSTDAQGNPLAFGLMQLLPSTARSLEAEYEKQFGSDITFDVENPEQNIHAGVLLLRQLLAKYKDYDNQYELAAANYNCGGIANAAAKYCSDKNGCWEKIKPYMGTGKEFCMKSDETIPYVERIIRLRECFDLCLKTQGSCYTMDYCKSRWNA